MSCYDPGARVDIAMLTAFYLSIMLLAQLG